MRYSKQKEAIDRCLRLIEELENAAHKAKRFAGRNRNTIPDFVHSTCEKVEEEVEDLWITLSVLARNA